jgi:hypothetical protein
LYQHRPAEALPPCPVISRLHASDWDDKAGAPRILFLRRWHIWRIIHPGMWKTGHIDRTLPASQEHNNSSGGNT